MRTRLLKILDEGTSMHCLVTQFEPSDIKECQSIGIDTSFKILNVFQDSYISTFAGYKFSKDYFKNRVRKDVYEGTSKAIGRIVDQIQDIRYLPNPLNVCAARETYNKINSGMIYLSEIISIISDETEEYLKKTIFSTSNYIHLCIVNVKTSKVIWETYSSWNEAEAFCIYLWIPLNPMSSEEKEKIKVSEVKVEFLA